MSSTLVVSITIPGGLLLILLAAVIFILGHISGRFLQKRYPTQKTRTNSTTDHVVNTIQEYACTVMVPSPGTSARQHRLSVPPAVPSSPRPSLSTSPTKQSGSRDGRFNDSPGSGVAKPPEPTYAVLEEPTRATYVDIDDARSLARLPNATSSTLVADACATVDGNDALVTSQDREGEGVKCDDREQAPLYFELEDPKKSSLIRQRNNEVDARAQMSGSDLVASDTCGNEGLGPPRALSASPPPADPAHLSD